MKAWLGLAIMMLQPPRFWSRSKLLQVERVAEAVPQIGHARRWIIPAHLPASIHLSLLLLTEVLGSVITIPPMQIYGWLIEIQPGSAQLVLIPTGVAVQLIVLVL